MPRCFQGLLDLDATVSSPEYQVNNNPNTTWGDYLLFNLRHTLGLMANSDVPIVLYIAPIAWSDEVGLDKRNDNNTEIETLTQICQLFKQEPNLFMKAKSTCPDYEKLYHLCSPILQQLRDEANERMDNANYTANNQYTIIKDLDFNEAHEIGNYSSMQDGSTCLCYTQNNNTWRSWTKSGENTAFVCLKDGWKEMQPEAGPNAPYDEYGLSMIFVFVNPKGELVGSNTRWNHQNAGNTNVDHAFTEEQISNIIGVRFKDAFKPLTEEERQEKETKKYLTLSQEFLKNVASNGEEFLVKKGMRQNEKQARVVDHFTNTNIMIVRYKDYLNVYDAQTHSLDSPDKWYNYWWDIEIMSNQGINDTYLCLTTDSNSFSLFNPQGQPVIKNMKGEIVSAYFRCGYIVYELEDGKQNYLGLDGKLLFPNTFFYSCNSFDERTQLAVVRNDEGFFNYATTKGEIVLDTWANEIHSLTINHILLMYGNKENIFNKETRQMMFPEDVYYVKNNYSDGFIIVRKDNKFNFVDISDNEVFCPQQWFDGIEYVGYRQFEVTLNGQSQIINLDLL